MSSMPLDRLLLESQNMRLSGFQEGAIASTIYMSTDEFRAIENLVITGIKKSMRRRGKNVRRIASDLTIDELIISLFIENHGITGNGMYVMDVEDLLSDVDKSGITSSVEISRLTAIHPRMKKYRIDDDLFAETTYSQHLRAINAAINSGNSDVVKVIQTTGLSTTELDEYRKLEGIKIFESEGQLEEFMQIKRNEESILGELFVLLSDLCVERADGNRAFANAMEIMQTTQRQISVQKAYEIFRLYYLSVNGHEKRSVNQIAEHVGTYPKAVTRLLRDVNLPPPLQQDKRKKVLLIARQKSSARKLYKLGLPIKDIAHFINEYFRAEQVYTTYASLLSNSRRNHLSLEVFHPHLSFRLASRVYEALDLDFNIEEVAELEGTDTKLINIAKENREKIEPILIEALREITRDVWTPYLGSVRYKNIGSL